jgi:hypothetical protein
LDPCLAIRTPRSRCKDGLGRAFTNKQGKQRAFAQRASGQGKKGQRLETWGKAHPVDFFVGSNGCSYGCLVAT